MQVGGERRGARGCRVMQPGITRRWPLHRPGASTRRRAKPLRHPVADAGPGPFFAGTVTEFPPPESGYCPRNTTGIPPEYHAVPGIPRNTCPRNTRPGIPERVPGIPCTGNPGPACSVRTLGAPPDSSARHRIRVRWPVFPHRQEPEGSVRSVFPSAQARRPPPGCRTGARNLDGDDDCCALNLDSERADKGIAMSSIRSHVRGSGRAAGHAGQHARPGRGATARGNSAASPSTRTRSRRSNGSSGSTPASGCPTRSGIWIDSSAIWS